MARRSNSNRRLSTKHVRDDMPAAAADAAFEIVTEALQLPANEPEQEHSRILDVIYEKDDADSALVPIPSSFAPSIVHQDADEQKQAIYEAQAESIQLLRKLWAVLEAKKKAKWIPSPIQLSSWPVLLPEKTASSSTTCNMIGIAPTGTGKTLAYGIPMCIMASVPNSAITVGGVCGVVLVPTRELGSQIERELKIVATCFASKHLKPLKIISVCGGADREDQMAWLCSSKKKCMLVTATPGRLIDLLQEKRVKKALTDTVRMVVLDEADRMATCSDMAEQVGDILKAIVNPDVMKTRLCLFSATYPVSVKKKWNEWVSKPRVCIKINTTVATATPSEHRGGVIEDDEDEEKKRKRGGGPMELAKIPSHVTQTVQYCVDADEKVNRLITTLIKIRKDETNAKARRKGLCIVFFNRIKTLQAMSKILNRDHGMKCGQFHGEQKQKDRDRTLSDFKSGKSPTLLATDIAARGIHVNNVQYVINHDFPETLDQVRTHRP
jgi:ATP-dependent RNA helicase DDX5/DBP2